MEGQPYFWIIGASLAGLIAGSFLGAMISRWPAYESVIAGRSRCDSCAVSLKWFELLPVVSYFLQRGRCRNCGKPIDQVSLLMELGCAVIAMTAVALSAGIAGIAGAIFGWLLLALAVFDLKYFWLPDRLTGVLALAGLVSGFLVVSPVLTDRIIGGAAGFLSLYLIAYCYRRIRGREGMGGGDPKLLGAIGCWLGWQYLPFVLVGASFAALLSVSAMKLRGQEISGTSRLPLGSYMAIAAFPVWIWITGSTAF